MTSTTTTEIVTLSRPIRRSDARGKTWVRTGEGFDAAGVADRGAALPLKRATIFCARGDSAAARLWHPGRRAEAIAGGTPGWPAAMTVPGPV